MCHVFFKIQLVQLGNILIFIFSFLFIFLHTVHSWSNIQNKHCHIKQMKPCYSCSRIWPKATSALLGPYPSTYLRLISFSLQDKCKIWIKEKLNYKQLRCSLKEKEKKRKKREIKEKMILKRE